MSEKIRPLSPDEVVPEIPDAMVQAVNESIREKWNGRQATVLQQDIVNRYRQISGDNTRELIDKGWLNFESLFESAG